MNRGDVYWCQFEPPDKRRPVVVLTRQSALHFLTGITVAPITGTLRQAASQVPLSLEDGLLWDCCVNCDAIQTVPIDAFREFITPLSTTKLRDVESAVRFALGLR